MKNIREKLRSESGASILLALLFFLLCAMVGASVLMAAASNAGKSRSNREEQQKYLTLSSALQLVCDELTAAKYTANFKAGTHIEHFTDGTDTDGKPIKVHDYWEYHYEQIEGNYTNGFSQNVLPLRNALDGLFAKSLSQTFTMGKDVYIYQAGSGVAATSGETFGLTLTVDQDDKPGLAQPVKVEVTLNENYRLSLKGWLENDSTYTMYGTLLVSGTPQITAGNPSSSTIEWKLSQITREAPT